VKALVSITALAVIIFGCQYAYGRERLRNSLPTWYAEDNARFFDGQLPSVYLWWGNLKKQEARSLERLVQ